MSSSIHTILHAIDTGPGSREVLDRVISVARQLGAKLEVVRIIKDDRDTSIVELDSYVPEAALNRYYEDHAQRIQKEVETQVAAIETANPASRPNNVKIKVLEGDDIARLILEESQAISADLIVLGSHGESALVEMFGGSVAHEVLLKTRIPVLLVPVNS